MKNKKPAFVNIVQSLEGSHSEKLMRKARCANRIAKMLRGHRRRLAYDVKANALRALVRKLPGRVDIRMDIVLTDFVVVELKNTKRGLHFPAVLI